MPSPNAEIIDAYFGYDTYDWAAELQRRARLYHRRYYGPIRNAFGVYDDGLSWRVDLLDGISADVDDAFRMVANGQKVDKNQFKVVLELFETASDCVEYEVEMFEGMMALGLASGFLPFVRMFPYRELAQELQAYQAALRSLEAALEKARRKETEAYIDKGIDVLQGIITFAFPEIDLAKEIALGFGGLFADSRLGPQGPDASKIVRTTATTLKDPIAKVTKMSESMQKVAKGAAKVNAVYDVVNLDEIKAARASVKDIEAAIETEKKVHRRLVEDIWNKWALRVWNFKQSLERANKALEESRNHAQELRSALAEQREIANFRGAVRWRVNR
jgi:hypothetical protein